MQQEQGVQDELPITIYPTDALVNKGINTQTLVPDIAYYYLRNTIGLSEEIMWKVTLESGSILGMTPRNLEKKVSLLRRTMNLSDEDVRVILGKFPTLLQLSADRNLAPTILFLVRSLDLSKSELRTMVMDSPSMLGYSLGNLSEKIAFFVSLGADREGGIDSVRELLVRTPRLLLSGVDTGLVPKLNFLTQEINFSIEEVWRICQKNPRLLMYSLDDNLCEKLVFFFILQLQLKPEDVRKILLAYPHIMDYNLENHLKPIAEYFTKDLEYSAAEFGSIILKFPRVFSYSLVRIKHVTGFLRYEVELDSRQAKRVIYQAPQILGLGESNIKDKLDFLKNRLALTADELGLVLSKMPTLMCLGIHTLASKLDYLEDSFDSSDTQMLKDTILTQPSLLGYSLELRIQPRMQQLKAAGIQPYKISVCISMPEAQFQNWLSSSHSKRTGELNFNEDELNDIYSKVPGIYDWTVSSIRSWIAYLKKVMNVSVDELKVIVLSHPQLLDGSSRAVVRRRLKMLSSICPVIMENLETLSMSDDEFNGWIRRKQQDFGSKISYLTKTLELDDTERRALVAYMPSLDDVQANKNFRDRLDYFYVHAGNSTKDVKLLLLGNPSLLDVPINILKARMQRVQLAKSSAAGNAASMLTMSDKEYATTQRWNESRTILMDSLGFTQNDAEYVLLHTQSILKSDPKDSLLPILNYLLKVFDWNQTSTATCVRANPTLLDHSLKDCIMPRMKLILDAGLDPSLIIDIVNLSSHEVDRRDKLQTSLNLTNAELNHLFPLKDWLADRKLRSGAAEPIIQYLHSDLGLSMHDVKVIFLGEPKLLTTPLSKVIQSRFDMLLEAGCPLPDIGKIVFQSDRKVDNHCSTVYLSRLGFSSNEISGLFASPRPKFIELRESIEYLLHNVFEDSEVMLKDTIVQTGPTILKSSLQHTIKSKVEILQYLRSIGLDFNSTDIAKFLMQKELAPGIKTWHPNAVFDGENNDIDESTQDKKRILAVLKDIPQSSALAYSDDPNRDDARVVHWR
jgi:mTERF domain-containing protein